MLTVSGLAPPYLGQQHGFYCAALVRYVACFPQCCNWRRGKEQLSYSDDLRVHSPNCLWCRMAAGSVSLACLCHYRADEGQSQISHAQVLGPGSYKCPTAQCLRLIQRCCWSPLSGLETLAGFGLCFVTIHLASSYTFRNMNRASSEGSPKYGSTLDL